MPSKQLINLVESKIDLIDELLSSANKNKSELIKATVASLCLAHNRQLVFFKAKAKESDVQSILVNCYLDRIFQTVVSKNFKNALSEDADAAILNSRIRTAMKDDKNIKYFSSLFPDISIDNLIDNYRFESVTEAEDKLREISVTMEDYENDIKSAIYSIAF